MVDIKLVDVRLGEILITMLDARVEILIIMLDARLQETLIIMVNV